MATSLLSVTSGSETQAASMAKVHAFHAPRSPEQRGMSELFLSACAGNPEYRGIVEKVGVPIYVPAREGVDSKLGGSWITQGYQIRDGEVIKLFGQRRIGSQGIKYTASMLIQMRRSGPYQEITVELLSEDDSTKPRIEIKGRFDIIDTEKAKLVGVRIPSQFEHQFDSSMVEELFSWQVLEPETEEVTKTRKAVVVDRATKTAKVVQTSRLRRAVDLD